MRSKPVRNSVTVSGFPGRVSLPLFLLLLGMPLPALTDPGDLDPTFGSGGRVLTDLARLPQLNLDFNKDQIF